MSEPDTTTATDRQPDVPRRTDTDAMNDLAAFINSPGAVSGADLVSRVEELLEATGRVVLDNADQAHDSDCVHDR
jgi:hypothetical protein